MRTENLEKSSSLLEFILIEGGIVFFTLWTILAHFLTFFKLTILSSILAFPVLAAFSILVLKKLYEQRQKDETSAASSALRQEPQKNLPFLLLQGYAAGILCLLFATKNFYYFTINVTLFFLLSMAFRKGEGKTLVSFEAPSSSPFRVLLIWTLAVAISIFSLCMHRSDLDDVNGHSTSTYIADNPSNQLFDKDTKHPAENFSYLFIPHKVETILLLASFSKLFFGLDVAYFNHFLLLALASLVAVLVHARFFKEFTPKTWALNLLVVELLYFILAETHRSFGLFAYTRMFQGKAIFLTVMAPLLIYYTRRFVRNNSKSNFALLLMGQICALGLTSSAIWCAPCISVFTCLASVDLTKKKQAIQHVATTILACSYTVAIALLVVLELKHSPLMDFLTQFNSLGVSAKEYGANDYLLYAFGRMFEWNPVSFACLFAALTGWMHCDSRETSRFFLVYALLFFLLVFNPLLTPYWLKVTSQITYWRIFWILPFPFYVALTLGFKPKDDTRYAIDLLSKIILLSLVLYSLLHAHTLGVWALGAGLFILWLGFQLLRSLRKSATFRTPFRNVQHAVFLLAIATMLPTGYVFSASKGTSIAVPHLKFDQPQYHVAKKVAGYATQRDMALAPEEISMLLVTFHEHPSPILTVRYWDRLMNLYLTPEEMRERSYLREYVTGANPLEREERFRKGIERYNFKVVCLAPSVSDKQTASALLREKRYVLQDSVNGYEIWVKK